MKLDAPALTAVRPPAEVAEAFHRNGWWQRQTVLHDLYRASAAHPNRTAVVAHRSHGADPIVRLSYAQLTTYVDRFAHALATLGVGPGDPVAFQLPNWWESSALLFACLRIGAVAMPILPSYGARDLAAALEATQPRVCVMPEVWGGVPHAEVLADLGAAMPWPLRRVIVGDAAATGAVDFAEYFRRTPHERHRRHAWLRMPADAADRVCLIVNAIALDDTHSMFLHTPNTLRAAIAPTGALEQDVTLTALPIAVLPSLLHGVLGPATRGGTAVLLDDWDPEGALDLMAHNRIGQVYALPAQWSELVSAQLERPRELACLRRALSADSPGNSNRLVREAKQALGVALKVIRGSPEMGVNNPASGMETALTKVDDTAGLFRIRVRGPSACLAVWRRSTGQVELTWPERHGWFDTGDLIQVDAAGRVKVWQRPAEEIGGVFLVPAAEVEAGLLQHPQVAEAVVLGRPDVEYGELTCAVVVPAGDPPALTELREHLTGLGLARAHLPARLELLGALPRDELGVVRRGQLREQLMRRWARRVAEGSVPGSDRRTLPNGRMNL